MIWDNKHVFSIFSHAIDAGIIGLIIEIGEHSYSDHRISDCAGVRGSPMTNALIVTFFQITLNISSFLICLHRCTS